MCSTAKYTKPFLRSYSRVFQRLEGWQALVTHCVMYSCDLINMCTQ